MCSVPKIEVPLIEFAFYTDECPCREAPRDMVEYWQPGQRAKMTTVRPVADARKLPGLWSVLAGPYCAWRSVPDLLTYAPEGQWPASLPSSRTLPTVSALLDQHRSSARLITR